MEYVLEIKTNINTRLIYKKEKQKLTIMQHNDGSSKAYYNEREYVSSLGRPWDFRVDYVRKLEINNFKIVYRIVYYNENSHAINKKSSLKHIWSGQFYN